MLAELESYDEIKAMVLRHLRFRECTECREIRFVWMWHFICLSCFAKLRYDPWYPDFYCRWITETLEEAVIRQRLKL